MVREGTQILDVLMSMFSGDKDEFGKEDVPPLPLLFDRVNAGRPPRSNAALFQLPDEILGLILVHVKSECLSALALVNHDCLQLARSRQFCSIMLDYSYASSDLVLKLLLEATRRRDAGAIMIPSLGSCIRRITIATNPGWVSHRHGVQLGPGEFQDLPENEKTKRMVEASDAFFGVYMFSIELALNAVPNLELLDFEDHIVMAPSFFKTIALSPIKHLKLFRTCIGEEFAIQLPEGIKEIWPLQSLDLELVPAMEKYGELSTSPLSTSILRLCASTLKVLSLDNVSGADPLKFANHGLESTPRFSNLRELTIGSRIMFEDDSFLSALVTDNLRTLDAPIERTPAPKGFFQQRGHVPALERFVWEDFHLPADHPLEFVRANSQITKFALPRASPGALLDFTLLPLLSESFTNLTSLNLIWDGTSISESSLEMISSIRTLEQLHLSSGNQYGWKHDWTIDHEMMRKHLCELPFLKKVAFSRDTYDCAQRQIPNTNYYAYQSLSRDDMPNDPANIQKVWEQKHRAKMLNEAEQYIKILAELGWIFLGQIPMRVI